MSSPRASGLLRTAATIMLVFACALLRPGSAGAEEEALEYKVKATFLYKFGLFVEWPAAAFPSADSTVNLCVVGADPFGKTLDKAVHGQAIKGRPIAVRRLESAGRDSGCHILYAGGSDAQSAADAVAAVRGGGVLTVTDAQSAGAAAGIIHFVIESARVRFEIDNGAAVESGLAISSRLLSLASSVR